MFSFIVMTVMVGTIVYPVSVEASIYIKVSDTGSIALSSTPKSKQYKRVIATSGGEGFQPDKDKLQEAIERATGKTGMPPSLISAIISASEDKGRAPMVLPDTIVRQHGDTVLRDTLKNVMIATQFFRKMLGRYEGNMTLALAAYRLGPGPIDQVGGIPPESGAREFVNRVQKEFNKIESRSEIIYTFHDKSGTLHVVNIRGN
ncbi:MAG: transglycosylase SLT domain-containing protein [bacterium]